MNLVCVWGMRFTLWWQRKVWCFVSLIYVDWKVVVHIYVFKVFLLFFSIGFKFQKLCSLVFVLFMWVEKLKSTWWFFFIFMFKKLFPNWIHISMTEKSYALLFLSYLCGLKSFKSAVKSWKQCGKCGLSHLEKSSSTTKERKLKKWWIKLKKVERKNNAQMWSPTLRKVKQH